jgi:hypothetical protein
MLLRISRHVSQVCIHSTHSTSLAHNFSAFIILHAGDVENRAMQAASDRFGSLEPHVPNMKTIAAVKAGLQIVADIARSFNGRTDRRPERLQSLAPQATTTLAKALYSYSWLSKLQLSDQVQDENALAMYQSLVSFAQRWGIGRNFLSVLETLRLPQTCYMMNNVTS